MSVAGRDIARSDQDLIRLPATADTGTGKIARGRRAMRKPTLHNDGIRPKPDEKGRRHV